jgi:hypothetical protein
VLQEFGERWKRSEEKNRGTKKSLRPISEVLYIFHKRPIGMKTTV